MEDSITVFLPHMRVVVRVRAVAKESGVTCEAHVGNRIATRLHEEPMEFSSVLGPESTQREAFQCCGCRHAKLDLLALREALQAAAEHGREQPDRRSDQQPEKREPPRDTCHRGGGAQRHDAVADDVG